MPEKTAKWWKIDTIWSRQKKWKSISSLLKPKRKCTVQGFGKSQCLLSGFSEVVLLSSGYLWLLQQHRGEGMKLIQLILTYFILWSFIQWQLFTATNDIYILTYISALKGIFPAYGVKYYFSTNIWNLTLIFMCFCFLSASAVKTLKGRRGCFQHQASLPIIMS